MDITFLLTVVVSLIVLAIVYVWSYEHVRRVIGSGCATLLFVFMFAFIVWVAIP